MTNPHGSLLTGAHWEAAEEKGSGEKSEDWEEPTIKGP